MIKKNTTKLSKSMMNKLTCQAIEDYDLLHHFSTSLPKCLVVIVSNKRGSVLSSISSVCNCDWDTSLFTVFKIFFILKFLDEPSLKERNLEKGTSKQL